MKIFGLIFIIIMCLASFSIIAIGIFCLKYQYQDFTMFGRMFGDYLTPALLLLLLGVNFYEKIKKR